MEKTKKKAIEQSGVRKGSPMEGVGWVCSSICTCGKDLRKRYLLSLEWKKRVGVMDSDRGH